MKFKERCQIILWKIKSSLALKTKQGTLLVLASSFVFILGIGIYFSVLVRSLEKRGEYNGISSVGNASPNLLSSSSQDESFCFAHISDAHADEYQNQLINAVLYFNNTLKPPFIIDTGDTVSNNTEQQNFSLYRQWVELSRSRIYAVPGNHDYQGGIMPFTNYFVDTKVVFDYKDYRFIGFSSFAIDYQWLEARLSEWPKGKSILFTHLPVSWPPELTHEVINLSTSDQEQIKNLMVRYQVLAYLSGHLHEPFSLATTFPSESQVGTILDIGAPSLGHKSAYQLICLANGIVSNYQLSIGTQSPITPTPGPGSPTTVSFQQRINGYLGNKDTYITLYNESNSCSDTISKVGYKQQSATLTYFDLSSLPPGTIIGNAKLSLYAAGSSGEGTTTIGAYKMFRDWTDCQATYYKPKNGAVWGTSGGNNTTTNPDRETTPLSFLITSGIQKWYDFDLTEAVQSWVNDPSTNKGVLLRQVFPSQYSFIFASSEDSNNPPKLTITYYRSIPPISGTASPTPIPTSTARPTLAPTTPPASSDCSSSCGSDIYLFNNATSANHVGLTNQYSYFILFIPASDVRLKEEEVLIGQWGNAGRSATCKVTDVNNVIIGAEKSTGNFSNVLAWRKISFEGLSFSQRPLFRAGQTYKLFCRGQDSWDSIYWKGGSQNSDPRAAKILASPCCSQSPAPTSSPLLPTSTSQPITPTLAPTIRPTLIPTSRPTSTPTRTPPAATATPASGTISLTLQQGLNGYAGTADTYLYLYDPTASYCNLAYLKVGYKKQNDSLVRFDLSSIPQNATVDNATLSLYAESWGGTDISIGAYQILNDWQACQVNWNQATSEETPIASLNTSGALKWYDFGLTSAVRSWVNTPSTNKGVLLRAIDSSAFSFRFSSSESSNQPKLVIRYHL